MIIDWHTHVIPLSKSSKPVWSGRCPMTVDAVLEAQEQVGVDLTVISDPHHYLRHLSGEEAVAALRASNLHLAEAQAKHAGKLAALACSVPCGEDAYLRELERAVRVDGLRGVIISSSHRGAYPDDPGSDAFFRLVTDLDVPVMLHPPAVGYGEERMSEFRLASSVGRPFDSCLALSRLILYGVLERFPTLKLVATHLGGGICEVIGRLDYNYELQKAKFYTRASDTAQMLISEPPSTYLKRVYLNSVCYHLPAAKCALETVGSERFIFGTDAPPLTPLKKRGLDLIAQLPLTASERERVLSGNAKSLLKLG